MEIEILITLISNDNLLTPDSVLKKVLVLILFKVIRSFVRLLDIIDHKVNGYLAKPFETEDLSNGMKFILDSTQYDELCDNARQKSITKFDSRIVSTKYKELYTKILRCQN